MCKLPNPKEYDDMEELKKQSEEVVEQLTSLLKQMESYKGEEWVLDFCNTLKHLSITH